MKNKIPKTREEAFAILDKVLDDESKKVLIKEGGGAGHFGIGMWIRNKWIHPLKEEQLGDFMKMFLDDGEENRWLMKFTDEQGEHIYYTGHPDCVSSDILDKYVEYLKKK